MTLDLKLDTPFEDHRADEMSQGVLGTEQDRPDGWLKVAGRATYTETDPMGSCTVFSCVPRRRAR